MQEKVSLKSNQGVKIKTAATNTNMVQFFSIYFYIAFFLINHLSNHM